MYIQELRITRPTVAETVGTVPYPVILPVRQKALPMGRSEGTDYKIIQMAMITSIDCEQGGKHTVMWPSFWAFDVRLVVGADGGS